MTSGASLEGDDSTGLDEKSKSVDNPRMSRKEIGRPAQITTRWAS